MCGTRAQRRAQGDAIWAPQSEDLLETLYCILATNKVIYICKTERLSTILHGGDPKRQTSSASEQTHFWLKRTFVGFTVWTFVYLRRAHVNIHTNGWFSVKAPVKALLRISVVCFIGSQNTYTRSHIIYWKDLTCDRQDVVCFIHVIGSQGPT